MRLEQKSPEGVGLSMILTGLALFAGTAPGGLRALRVGVRRAPEITMNLARLEASVLKLAMQGRAHGMHSIGRLQRSGGLSPRAIGEVRNLRCS